MLRTPTSCAAAALVLFAVAILGCGLPESSTGPQGTPSAGGDPAPESNAVEGGEASPPGLPSPDEGNLARKIVYTAHVDVRVEDFDEARSAVRERTERHGGYVASAHLEGDVGTPRVGTWTIRIPAADFEAANESLLELGTLERTTLSSNEVTEEFYDLQKRIGNAHQTESRLLAHLDKSADDLEDILAVERELARVRGEIERMQGRLQVLDDLTALATIHLTLIERTDFAPPKAPTFATALWWTFLESWNALVTCAKAAVLLLAALAPWLPPILIVGLLVWRVGRRSRWQRQRPTG